MGVGSLWNECLHFFMASCYIERWGRFKSNVFRFYGWLSGKRILASMTRLGEEEFWFLWLTWGRIRGNRQEGRETFLLWPSFGVSFRGLQCYLHSDKKITTSCQELGNSERIKARLLPTSVASLSPQVISDESL